MLVQFYESNDMEPLKDFVYDQCIDGIAFEPVVATNELPESEAENEGNEDLER
jgi:hypothetical protein